MQAEATPVISGKDLQAVFKSFDKDHSGTIELTELRAVITEMGETITEKELNKMVKDMDTNGDGRISYPEFEYWWKFGQKGKLKRIVALKYKAMKLVHQANQKLTASGVKIKEHYSGELSSYEISFAMGDSAANIEANLEVCLLGQLYKATLELLRTQVPNLSNKTTLMFSFETKNATEGKQKVDDLISSLKNAGKENMDSLAFQIFSAFQVSTVVTGNTLSIIFEPDEQSNPMEGPLGNITEAIETLGKEFSFKLSGTVKLRGSITEAFSTMKFVKWIAQGFTATFRLETNEGLVKNLRKMVEAQTNVHEPNFFLMIFLTLLNTAKLNLKFKSPENIDEFFDSLGIGQLSEQSPNFGELLEEISADVDMPAWKQPTHKFHHLYQVLQFIMDNVDDKLRIDFLLPFLIVRAQLKCVGGGYLFNTAFRSAPAPSASN